MRASVLALAALALAGCETSAEKSALLERQAKRHQHRQGAQRSALQALAAGKVASRLRVSSASVLHSREGSAAIVTVRNPGSSPLREIPILITVTDSGGHALYSNNLPGLSPSLTSIAQLPAHGSFSWIDDQIQAAGTPTGVTARLGEGQPAGASAAEQPKVKGTLTEGGSEGGTVEGTVSNSSGAPLHEVIVYALARRGARTVAAGRAVLAELSAHGSAHFQLFLIGNPSGSRLSLTAQAPD